MPVVSINIEAIMSKVKRATDNAEFKRQALSGSGVDADAYSVAVDLGEQCVRCIENALRDSGASGNMIYAAGDVYAGAPSKVYDGMYHVNVFVDQNARPSLNPNDEGLRDMAALVNNGYSGVRRRIRGIWHGKETLNMPYVPATHFVQQGVADFNGNYGRGDGVRAYAEITTDRFD